MISIHVEDQPESQIHANPDQKADPSTIKDTHDDHFKLEKNGS
jgi:hypothetical protein